jgi:hypothetical protein
VKRLLLLPLGLAALAALAGCGGASSDLKTTEDHLSRIRAATLELRVLVTPRVTGDSQPFGFKLVGPFDLRSGGPMPKLHVDYTQIANGRTATAIVDSGGRKATVRTGGRTVTLSAGEARGLRVVGGAFQKGSLDLTGWVRHPHVSSGPNGAERIDGDLDVGRALSYFAGLTGSTSPPLTKDEQKRLQEAVKSARIEVVTGRKDKLLRSVHFTADLGFEAPPDLRSALGKLVGAKLELELKLGNPQTA